MSLDKAGCVPLDGGMPKNSFPHDLSAAAIRGKLLERAEAFAARHKISLSRIGVEALNDSKFLAEVKNGRNFTIGSYEAVMDWMDAEEARRKTGAAA